MMYCITFLMTFLAVFLILPSAVAQQLCQDGISPTTPSHNFTVNSDGTILDHRTCLMWKKCSEGQEDFNCDQGIVRGYSWGEALEHGRFTKFAGYQDWRLPNIKELASIVERSCWLPAINLDVFPNTPPDVRYWSSSPTKLVASQALDIDFDDGDDGSHRKTLNGGVRLVRTLNWSEVQQTCGFKKR